LVFNEGHALFLFFQSIGFSGTQEASRVAGSPLRSLRMLLFLRLLRIVDAD
jgi:hypothetical protein